MVRGRVGCCCSNAPVGGQQHGGSAAKQPDGGEAGGSGSRDKRAGRKRKADAEPEAVTPEATPAPKAKAKTADGRGARRATAATAAATEAAAAPAEGRPEPRSKRLKVRLGFGEEGEEAARVRCGRLETFLGWRGVTAVIDCAGHGAMFLWDWTLHELRLHAAEGLTAAMDSCRTGSRCGWAVAAAALRILPRLPRMASCIPVQRCAYSVSGRFTELSLSHLWHVFDCEIRIQDSILVLTEEEKC